MKGAISRLRSSLLAAMTTRLPLLAQAGRVRELLVLRRHDADLRHPAVHRVLGPVLVGEEREAAGAPALAPRVLDDKALRRVTDDREGMAAVARLRGAERDHPVGELPFLAREAGHPAVVADRARIEDAGLDEAHVHIGHRAHVDAVVGAERAAHGLVPPVVIGGRRGLRHRFGPPQLGAADAMLEPALHRAAQARAGVLLDRTGELVVAARHRVDHEGGDGRLLRAEVAAAEVGHHRREREAGAGVGVLLVEDRQRDLRIRPHPLRRRPRHRRQVAPVAQVELVRDDVALELARPGAGRFAAARLRCHREPPSRRRRRRRRNVSEGTGSRAIGNPPDGLRRASPQATRPHPSGL